MTTKINLKLIEDPTPNACALGRHTIGVSMGALSLTDEEIEGLLAHEVAHLACHHTDISLLIGSGNFIITAFILICKFIGWIFKTISLLLVVNENTRTCGCFSSIASVFFSCIVWLWTKFCMLFLMWSSRANEYAADKYAMELGYGYELAAVLDKIGTGMPSNTFLRTLYSTHPNTHDRIGKLQEMGVPYARY